MTIVNSEGTRRRLGSDELRHRLAWGTGLTLWFVGVLAGFGILLVHDTSASPAASSNSPPVRNLSQFHGDTFLESLRPQIGNVEVVMALHPKCPCSLNSLDELSRLLANAPESPSCTLLVYAPKDASEDWFDTANMQVAEAIENVRLVMDGEAENAQKLGLTDSGACMIISDQGEILFRGGITAGRTCVAESPGSRTVASILRGEPSVSITTPVFGCKLSTIKSQP